MSVNLGIKLSYENMKTRNENAESHTAHRTRNLPSTLARTKYLEDVTTEL